MLAEVRRLFATPSYSPFGFASPSQAAVIPGYEEGLNDWMAVNYHLGNFQKGKRDTVGVLDMVSGWMAATSPVRNDMCPVFNNTPGGGSWWVGSDPLSAWLGRKNTMHFNSS